MNLLLDTYALIWFLEGDLQLSQTAKSEISNPDNTCFIIQATLWEMAIKLSIGKLEMKNPYHDLPKLMWENGIEILTIEFEHFEYIINLPFHHKDPFDRIIIAQSIIEKMPLISIDGCFKDYPVDLIW
jgi:PIN domain nuclease of toxin-antitoxin system